MARELRVVIATAGRPSLLGRTLVSLAQCRKPAAFREVVVVENGPALGAADIVANCPADLRARYVHIEQPGKSRALNHVFAQFPDDCLVFMTDDDVRFDENVLVAYAEAAAGLDGGHFFGGVANVDYETPPPPWLVEFMPRSARGWCPGLDIANKRVKFLGFNWAAFAGDIRGAGGFDENVGPGSPHGSTGQETAMQRALYRQQCQARFVPGATVWHYVPAERCSAKWVIERAYRHGMQKGMRLREERLLLSLPMAGLLLANASLATLRLGLTRLSRNGRVRFRSQYKFEKARGCMAGCWSALSVARSGG